MSQKWISNDLPHAAQIDDAAFQAYLKDTTAKNLHELSDELGANTDIACWIKEAVTIEIAHQRALQDHTPAPSADWFASTNPDTLGLMKLKLAPCINLYYFDHDVLSWYASNSKSLKPEEAPSFILAGKALTSINEAQYHLLEAICQSAMLGDALDKWVSGYPALAATHAGEVGPWLRTWIKHGVLVR